MTTNVGQAGEEVKKFFKKVKDTGEQAIQKVTGKLVTIHHIPHTIHHIPYTIHHTPYTIYHIPYTIYHIPYTIH
ncbi:hypothetical protein EON63_19000, partial [archaeon]